MFRRTILTTMAAAALLLGCTAPLHAQQQALDSITAGELRMHLAFISADEMQGRDTPSPGLNMAALYLATRVEAYGLTPLMPDGSFYQTIPLSRTVLSRTSTLTAGGRTFMFPTDFGASGSTAADLTGELVLVGYGASDAEAGWDDYSGLDLQGKIAVLLEGELPEGHALRLGDNRRLRSMRTFTPAGAGAVAVLNVISPSRERAMTGAEFEVSTGGVSWPAGASSPPRSSSGGEQRGGAPRGGMQRGARIPVLELRHDAAAAVLGISRAELEAMFARLARGERIEGRALSGRQATIDLETDTLSEHTQNVVAMVPGSDPVLKDEYVVIGAHYDHVGIRHGAYPDSICNGADDNGSGTVSMLEIAQAMTIERPKRSVIFVWHAGEEKGLRGAWWFVQNCPVPLEKINAMLQMDMISRNDHDSICLIGSHFVSSELDAAHRRVCDRLGLIAIDDKYNDPDLPTNNYHRQSDHYAYHSYSIPATFFFSDITPELHTPADEIHLCDFDKAERVTKFVYASALELGNMPRMVALDRNPEITQRGQRISTGR